MIYLPCWISSLLCLIPITVIYEENFHLTVHWEYKLRILWIFPVDISRCAYVNRASQRISCMCRYPPLLRGRQLEKPLRELNYQGLWISRLTVSECNRGEQESWYIDAGDRIGIIHLLLSACTVTCTYFHQLLAYSFRSFMPLHAKYTLKRPFFLVICMQMRLYFSRRILPIGNDILQRSTHILVRK